MLVFCYYLTTRIIFISSKFIAIYRTTPNISKSFFCQLIPVMKKKTFDHTSKSYLNHILVKRSFGYCDKMFTFWNQNIEKKKKVTFKPPNDHEDKIETSETSLRIYRAPQNIFQEIILLLLKMKEEFEEKGFVWKKTWFLPNIWPRGLPEHFRFFFHNNVT